MGALNHCHLDADLDDGVGFPNGEDKDLRKVVRVLLVGMASGGLPLAFPRLFSMAQEGQKVKDLVQDALFPEVGLRKEVGQAGGAGGLVVVRDLDLFSYCESCLLPFRLECHIGYIPSGQRVLGLSKFSRVADGFAKRLQNPQRLADEIASALPNGISPAGVAFMLQCAHIYIPNVETFFLDSENRGWVKIVTSAGSGVFEDKSSNAWSDFVSLLKCGGPNMNGSGMEDNIRECWCPLSSTAPSCIESLYPGLTAPVTSIIRLLDEDPMRVENGHRERISSEMNLPFCALCGHSLLPLWCCPRRMHPCPRY